MSKAGALDRVSWNLQVCSALWDESPVMGCEDSARVQIKPSKSEYKASIICRTNKENIITVYYSIQP